MKRRIIEIHETLCNGCGLCVSACHEGAIQLVSGKAKLISDVYCDGLGDCLPACPTGAIEIIEREAYEYSQEAVELLMEARKEATPPGGPRQCDCHDHDHENDNDHEPHIKQETEGLKNWPIQLKLANVDAEYFRGADLLVAADCTAFAYSNFHKAFANGRVVVVGCPKLDDNKYYEDKLAEILSVNDIQSITVLRMEVPCCNGIVQSVKSAMIQSMRMVPYQEFTIKSNGELLK